MNNAPPRAMVQTSEEIMFEPMSADQEMQSANKEIEQMLWEALDNCYRAGAPKDDVQFIAWMAGLPDWTPKQHRRAA